MFAVVAGDIIRTPFPPDRTSCADTPCLNGQQCVGSPTAKEYFTPLKNETCINCMDAGLYCPAGTINTYAIVSNILCPAGYFCPDSRYIFACPEGKYCPLGSTKPTDCSTLGMYCPENSTQEEACVAGTYCPSPSEAVVCPSGSYCRAQRTAPSPCPLLSSCPQGSSVPEMHVTTIVSLAVLLVVLVVLRFVASHFEWRKRARRENVESHRDQSMLMLAQLLRSICKGKQGVKTARLLDKFQHWHLRSFSDQSCTFRCENTGLTLRNAERKQILRGVNLVIPAGCLVAVLGPSGCGKTTLLNVLASRAEYGHVEGRVLVNDTPNGCEMLRGQTGFVPQADVLFEDLSVRQNLESAAALRLPKNTPATEREQMIATVLRVLGIERVQHRIVGEASKAGLSGGQRKRVSIGMELVTKTSALFLDEPTSGLDASTSMDVLRVLRELTVSSSVPVVTVIHQPRYAIFSQFDLVLFLCPLQGQTVYYGPPAAAVDYFTQTVGLTLPPMSNPADCILDAIAEAASTGTMQSMVDAWTDKGEEFVENWLAVQAEEMPTTVLPLRASEEKDTHERERESSKLPALARTSSMTRPALHRVASKLRTNTVMFTSAPTLLLKKAWRTVSGRGGGGKLGLEEVHSVLVHYVLESVKDEGGWAKETAGQAADLVTEGLKGRLASLANGGVVTLDMFLKALDEVAGDQAEEAEERKEVEEAHELVVRETPTVLRQFFICLLRAQQQRLVHFKEKLGALLFTAFGAGIVGIAYGSDWSNLQLGFIALMSSMVLGLTGSIQGTLVFGQELLASEREHRGHTSTLAYFVARDVDSLWDALFHSLIFVALLFNLTVPLSPWYETWIVNFVTFWSMMGMGQLFSLLFSHEVCIVSSAMLPLSFGGFFGGINPTLTSLQSTVVGTVLSAISFSRWATEAILSRDVANLPGYTNPEYFAETYGFSTGLDVYQRGIGILLTMGILLRSSAFVIMLLKHSPSKVVWLRDVISSCGRRFPHSSRPMASVAPIEMGTIEVK